MEKAITAADVPPQFLEAAFLVGHIPQKSLAFDPRVSYALYVPPKHYIALASPGASDTVANEPSTAPSHSPRAKLPLLVYIHGTRRNISPLFTSLAAFADSMPCAILVPLFPAGIDGPNDLDSYKVLRSTTLRSDLALLSMLDDEIAHRWPHIETGKVFMMGFSGGGQFAHRFLYLYPERVKAVSVGAPGRTTVLDDEEKWPVGVADVESLFGRRVQRHLIAQVPIQLVVGSEDVEVHGGKEFAAWLAQVRHRQQKAKMKATATATDEAKPQHGGKETQDLLPMERGRLDTLRQLQSMWQRDGIESRLDVVEGVAHSGAGVRECVLQFLQPLIQRH